MQVSHEELRQIAAITARAGREDLYAGIHKALRAFMADTLVAVGRTDPADARDVGDTIDRVLALMAVCAAHVEHENTFMHPAIEARDPGTTATVAGDHEDHLPHIAALRAQADNLATIPPQERAAALHVLYLSLAGFVADNLQHMHVEETRLNRSLWAHYSDDELRGMHDALVASIDPPEMMQVLRWMVPNMSAPERLAVLGGMKAGAPAPVFEAVLDMLRPHLNERDWSKLTTGLGLTGA
ncbi:MAG: hemerythrin domain-containing protein [Burkholderiaceae bacterium]